LTSTHYLRTMTKHESWVVQIVWCDSVFSISA
jgi:hypothetical protein